jgi:hypothetical protein
MEFRRAASSVTSPRISALMRVFDALCGARSDRASDPGEGLLSASAASGGAPHPPALRRGRPLPFGERWSARHVAMLDP